MTSCCLLFGANGAIGTQIHSSALLKYDNVIPFDVNTDNNVFPCDLTSSINFPLLFKPLSLHKNLTHLDLIFSQRPFLNLKPQSFSEDVHQAIDIACLSPIAIIEYLSSTYFSAFKSISFLGSINSTFVCDQPLSYMISKSATDTAVRFLSNRFPNHCFLNFSLGLVDIPSKSNSFSNNPDKLNSAYAAVGKKTISTDTQLASILVDHTYDFCLPMSGSTIHLDNGQHFTDPFWSARISQISF